MLRITCNKQLHFVHETYFKGMYECVSVMGMDGWLLQLFVLDTVHVFTLQWVQWHGHAHVLLAGTSEGTMWMWRIPSGDCKTFPSHGCRNTCGTILVDGGCSFSLSPSPFPLLLSPSLSFSLFTIDIIINYYYC